MAEIICGYRSYCNKNGAIVLLRMPRWFWVLIDRFLDHTAAWPVRRMSRSLSFVLPGSITENRASRCAVGFVAASSFTCTFSPFDVGEKCHVVAPEPDATFREHDQGYVATVFPEWSPYQGCVSKHRTPHLTVAVHIWPAFGCDRRQSSYGSSLPIQARMIALHSSRNECARMWRTMARCAWPD